MFLVRKYIYIVFILMMSICGNSVFAQDAEPLENDCPEYTPEIVGSSIIVKDSSQEYTYVDDALEKKPLSSFALYSGDDIVASTSGALFAHAFSQPGKYVLEHTQAFTGSDCNYSVKKNVQVYNKLITYIGPSSDEVHLSRESMNDTNTYIHEILVDDISLARGEQFTTLLVDNSYYLQHANTLLVDGDLIDPLFDRLSTLQQVAGLTFEADLYVLSTINQSAFRRMVATYSDVLSVNTMYVVGKQHISSLLTSLLLDKNTQQLSFVKTYTVGLDASNRFMMVSYLVDYLLYNEFPLGALLFILLLPVLVLIISIFRQIIGLSVFGVFYPLFFAFSLLILGVPPTIIFFIGAFITTLIVRYFTKRIYLLHSAKVGLLVVFYCLITLVLLRLTHKYNIIPIDYSLFQNYYFLFAYLLILLVGNRLFSEQFYLFNTGRRTGLLEFAFVSLVIYWCISSQFIQNIVLGFPEVSLLSLIVIIIVGRFTGLQIVEYIRFLPLIKHYFEEEEE